MRLISATHQDLEQLIRENRFREDLYYRLNVVSLFLPPLRERKEDIPFLLDHFLKKFGRANGKEDLEVSREARDLLLRHDYPGNIRELENLVERAVVLARDNLITSRDIPFHLKEGLEESETPSSADIRSSPDGTVGCPGEVSDSAGLKRGRQGCKPGPRTGWA